MQYRHVHFFIWKTDLQSLGKYQYLKNFSAIKPIYNFINELIWLLDLWKFLQISVIMLSCHVCWFSVIKETAFLATLAGIARWEVWPFDMMWSITVLPFSSSLNLTVQKIPQNLQTRNKDFSDIWLKNYPIISFMNWDLLKYMLIKKHRMILDFR